MSEVAEQVDEDVVGAAAIGLHLNSGDQAGCKDNARRIAVMNSRELGEIRLSGNLEIHGVAAPIQMKREAEAGTIYRGSDVNGIDYQAGGSWARGQVDQLAGLLGSILHSHRVGDLHQSRGDGMSGPRDGQSERTGRKDQWVVPEKCVDVNASLRLRFGNDYSAAQVAKRLKKQSHRSLTGL